MTCAMIAAPHSGGAVLAALAVADGDGAGVEVDVFDPQAQTFAQAHAGAV